MTVHADTDALTQGPPVGTPRRLPIGELRALREPVRLVARQRELRNVPSGDGRVIVTIPGYGAGDRVDILLRRYLATLGYQPRGWGLGRNMGDPEADAARLAPKIERLSAEHGPATLVGWSLGGVVAREVARIVPEHVRSVVMYGSPVVGGPTHTILYPMFNPDDVNEIAVRQAWLDHDTPVSVPVTSIYSQHDGVVNWLACIDRWTPGARHVEVRSSHLGLPMDPDVWLAVADAVARD